MVKMKAYSHDSCKNVHDTPCVLKICMAHLSEYAFCQDFTVRDQNDHQNDHRVEWVLFSQKYKSINFQLFVTREYSCIALQKRPKMIQSSIVVT